MISSSSQTATQNRTDDPVSRRIVDRVAAQTGRDVTDLPPLYDALDPDALDRFVGSTEGDALHEIQVTFAGHRVTVDADGTVSCEPIADE